MCHLTRVDAVNVVRVGGVLERVEADESARLLHEVVTAEADGEEVLVFGIPTDARNGELLRPIVEEFPQRQQRALRVAVLVRHVLPIFEVLLGKDKGGGVSG